MFANIYEYGFGGLHSSRSSADAAEAAASRMGLIKITYTDRAPTAAELLEI